MDRKQEIVQTLLHVILGAGLCILLGYFFYGSEIFRKGFVLSQFVFNGIVGAIFYTFLKYRGMKTAWLSLAVLMIGSLIMAKVEAPLRIVPFIIGFGVMGLVLVVYQRYFVMRFSRIRVGKFIALSLMLAAGWFILSGIYGLVLKPPGFWDLLRFMIKPWLLMGAGMGLGLELAELIFPHHSPGTEDGA